MKLNNRILVVDDDEDIHRDFQKILSPVRLSELDMELERYETTLFDEPPKAPNPYARVVYQIDHAYRAETALEQVLAARLKNEPYALVFTDVRIPPGIDGVQLVIQLLSQAPDTQIVIVTAFSDYSWEEMTRLFGWTDRLMILRKPVDPMTVKQLALMLTKKWNSERELNQHRLDLEGMVEQRTARLIKANQQLQDEIVERERAELALHQTHARLEEANRELHYALDQRKQTEEQLRVLLEELEAANHELENFAYIVSHDLKAPLRAISSITSWFHDDFAEVLGTVGQDYLMDLHDQVRWMHNLIEGILAYSRLGRAKCELKHLSSEQVVQRVVEVLSAPADVTITIENLPDIVYDQTHLEQVFQNLIGNAIKHAGPGTIRISAQEFPDTWVFQVADTGIGIDARHFQRIFKIFQTLKPREEAEDSTGIGLSLVKRIVERHGGTVWVESTPGEGSIFSFSIPKSLQPKQNPPGNTVIVIDDNRDFCTVAEAMLRRAGFMPLHVCSGSEALNLFTHYDGQLDLALLDLNLPGEDVFHFFPQLKKLRPNTRFLLCTGDPQSRAAALVQRLGADGTLIKPFNLEDLNEALARVFL